MASGPARQRLEGPRVRRILRPRRTDECANLRPIRAPTNGKRPRAPGEHSVLTTQTNAKQSRANRAAIMHRLQRASFQQSIRVFPSLTGPTWVGQHSHPRTAPRKDQPRRGSNIKSTKGEIMYRKRLKLGVSAVAMIVAAQSAVHAQGAQASAEQVVVTGSRVITNGNDSPTPLTVISTDTITA